MKEQTRYRFYAWGMIIIIMGGILFLSAMWDKWNSNRCTATAVGQVLRYSIEETKRFGVTTKERFLMTYVFYVNGKPYTREIQVSTELKSPTFSVRYDPENPENHELVPVKGWGFQTLSICGFGVILVAIGKWPRREKIKGTMTGGGD